MVKEITKKGERNVTTHTQLIERIKLLCDGQDGKPKNLQELAKEFGWGENSIYRWEDNAPSLVRVQQVADRLDVTLDYLVRGD